MDGDFAVFVFGIVVVALVALGRNGHWSLGDHGIKFSTGQETQEPPLT